MQFSGVGVRAVVTGKSVHNQRIERLWRDVRVGVVERYRSLFSKLESQFELNACNEKHFIALQAFFMEILNNHLLYWISIWINHKMRTENNKTPMRMFHETDYEKVYQTIFIFLQCLIHGTLYFNKGIYRRDA
jgi:hypothetical protein